jgi:hypothetical protein
LKGLAYGTLEGMELSGHFKLESRAAAYQRLLDFRKQDVEIYQLTEKYTQENEEMAHQVRYILYPVHCTTEEMAHQVIASGC